MVSILPPRTSLGTHLGSALGQGLSQGSQMGFQNLLQQRQGQQQAQQLSKALEGLVGGEQPLSQEEKFLKFIQAVQGVQGGPEYARQYSQLLQPAAPSKEMIKRQEQASSFQQGLQTVKQMRDLLESGDIGKLASVKVPFSAEARKNRQQFETLGTSLIGLYGSTLPTGIRNKTEFEEYMKGIARPGMTEASIRGSLDALETLFKTGIARQQLQDGMQVPVQILEAEQQAVSQLKQKSPKRTLGEIFK